MSDKTTLVSVLVVADGTPAAVLSTVKGLRSKFSDPERLQILLRVSEEDQELMFAISEFKKHGAEILVRPSGTGSFPRGVYLNELAKKARGYWLLPFDCNAEIVTRRWDLPLHRIQDPMCLAYFNEIPTTDDEPFTYPAFPRQIYDETGFISPISHWADWLRNLTRLAGLSTFFLPDVTVSVIRKAKEVSTDMDFSREVTEALSSTNIEDSSGMVQLCLAKAKVIRDKMAALQA